MILKINGNIDLPFSNTISIPKVPHVLRHVVTETNIDYKKYSKKTINPKLKKLLISASLIALSIGIKPLLTFASGFTFDVPDTVRKQLENGLQIETPMPNNNLLKYTSENLPKITGHDYTKDFWYRHGGVLTRMKIDKKHGVEIWERIGENLFNILFSIVKGFAKALGKFVLLNGDLFFLLPAVFSLLVTFMVGKHKYTKWTLPLFFFYFISQVFKGFVL